LKILEWRVGECRTAHKVHAAPKMFFSFLRRCCFNLRPCALSLALSIKNVIRTWPQNFFSVENFRARLKIFILGSVRLGVGLGFFWSRRSFFYGGFRIFSFLFRLSLLCFKFPYWIFLPTFELNQISPVRFWHVFFLSQMRDMPGKLLYVHWIHFTPYRVHVKKSLRPAFHLTPHDPNILLQAAAADSVPHAIHKHPRSVHRNHVLLTWLAQTESSRCVS
jgi:hypothetical protein